MKPAKFVAVKRLTEAVELESFVNWYMKSSLPAPKGFEGSEYTVLAKLKVSTTPLKLTVTGGSPARPALIAGPHVQPGHAAKTSGKDPPLPGGKTVAFAAV